MDTLAEALYEYADLISDLAFAADYDDWASYDRVNTKAHVYYQDVVVPLALEARP